jgi:hypothetical protein
MLGNLDLVYQFRDWYGSSPPAYQFILNQEPLLLKQWRKIDIEFTPNDNYDFINLVNIRLPCFECQQNNTVVAISALILDAVSDIYYAEPTYSLPSSDTLEAGSCYTFEPYTIHPYATTHRWSVLGEPIFHVGPTPTVCPTETTTYVVLSNDNCGWAESDTITIVVVPKVEPPPVPQDYFNVFPNPGAQGQNLNISSSQSGSIRLFDAAGRLLGTFSFEAGESTINKQFAAGVYLYQAILEKNQRKNGKYLVVK